MFKSLHVLTYMYTQARRVCSLIAMRKWLRTERDCVGRWSFPLDMCLYLNCVTAFEIVKEYNLILHSHIWCIVVGLADSEPVMLSV